MTVEQKEEYPCQKSRGKHKACALPPNEVLSQLQFCRANKGAARSRWTLAKLARGEPGDQRPIAPVAPAQWRAGPPPP
jgi:hypothetical protein